MEQRHGRHRHLSKREPAFIGVMAAVLPPGPRHPACQPILLSRTRLTSSHRPLAFSRSEGFTPSHIGFFATWNFTIPTTSESAGQITCPYLKLSAPLFFHRHKFTLSPRPQPLLPLPPSNFTFCAYRREGGRFNYRHIFVFQVILLLTNGLEGHINRR